MPNQTSYVRLVFFFLAAYLISWYAWILHAVGRSQETGIFPLGPIIAAALVSSLSGWSGFKAWLSRLVRFRVAWRWYAMVISLPIAIDTASALVNLALGAHKVPLDADHSPNGLPARFAFIFVFIGLGEEGGWRGFALPELRKSLSPIVASLVLGALWALWHLPLFGVEFSPGIIPAFLLSLFAATYVITWIADRAGDTVILPALLHAVVNVVGGGLVFQMFRGADLTRLWWIYASGWAITSIVLGKLGKPPAALREKRGDGEVKTAI